MSFPASATELRTPEAALAELAAAASIEMSARELHRAGEVAALLPATTCVYVPSLPGLPLSRTLQAVAALSAAGLDPVPHVAARRIADPREFEAFLRRAVDGFGVHRVMLVGGDEPQARGPFPDAATLLVEGVLSRCGVKEIGLAGYPEGHSRILAAELRQALERKLMLAAEQGLGAYVVTQFSFAPARVVEYCAAMERDHPSVPMYVGLAGPTDPAALARYAQRCGVSASLRALRTLGTGIARLVTHTDPREQALAIARHCAGRESTSVVGLHLYSFGSAVATASWLRNLLP
ncbi:MAG: methylenetetrahydrofolate reductase [Betaproteobacteria bacterium]|nr:methylenetetrahydrofolate reductase [Betaproteobacteria bacterium]